MAKVFIDGAAGTTGLRIADRLAARDDIDLVVLPDALRKDVDARAEALNSADVAFLCLPDAAAVQAAGLVSNPRTVVIDASTAHRTNPAWTYGFAELTGARQRIAQATRIANPGCHASGFISLVAPLVELGILPANAQLSATSLTGYSGGGKAMIADYEAGGDPLLAGGRFYGLTQQHKHLPEMAQVCGLSHAPIFCPIVEPYYSGMEVIVPLDAAEFDVTVDEIEDAYARYYATGLVRFVPQTDLGNFLSATTLSGYDNMYVTVCGNDDRLTLVSLFDNLGKGASGAAIQNMNIALGLDEALGLDIR